MAWSAFCRARSAASWRASFSESSFWSATRRWSTEAFSLSAFDFSFSVCSDLRTGALAALVDLRAADFRVVDLLVVLDLRVVCFFCVVVLFFVEAEDFFCVVVRFPAVCVSAAAT